MRTCKRVEMVFVLDFKQLAVVVCSGMRVQGRVYVCVMSVMIGGDNVVKCLDLAIGYVRYRPCNLCLQKE